MTLFELVKREVTARQAADVYGLHVGKNNKSLCPWHNDKHPSLQFYPDGGCYCFVCNRAGDATDVAAQLLGLSAKEAAERIRKDFHLNQPVEDRPNPEVLAARKKQKTERERKIGRYGYLCDVVLEADERLEDYTPETADAEFDMILAARCKAELEALMLNEELK